MIKNGIYIHTHTHTHTQHKIASKYQKYNNLCSSVVMTTYSNSRNWHQLQKALNGRHMKLLVGATSEFFLSWRVK